MRSSLVFLVIMLSGVWLSPPTLVIPNSSTDSSVVRQSVQPVVRDWADVELIYQDQWHDPDEVLEEIDNMHEVASEIMDIFPIGESYQGRNLTCVRITNEDVTEQRAKTLVVAHHHGREQITVELALRFMLYLVNGYAKSYSITKYIDTLEIFIIPTLNPDALEIVVNEQNYWLRKNLKPYDNDYDGQEDEDPIEDVDGDGHISEFDVYKNVGTYGEYLYSYYEGIDNDGDGQVNEDEIGLVDLNRNYDAEWGESGASGQPSEQTYRGRRPFSELETQAMRDFALQHRFAMAYSLHSGINATYLPSDNGAYLEPALYNAIIEDYNEILPSSFNTGRITTSNNGPHLEANLFGKWSDWMYLERATKVPVCFEVFHDGNVDQESAYEVVFENDTHFIKEWKGIYGYFAPEERNIQDLWRQLRPAFIYLLEMIPRLDIEIEVLPTIVGHENELRLNMTFQTSSPRLGTISNIQIFALNGTLLNSISALENSGPTSSHITLKFNESSSIYTVRVGNNYTGFTRLEILPSTVTITPTPATSTTPSTTNPTNPTSLGTEVIQLAGIGSVVLVMIAVILIRRRK